MKHGGDLVADVLRQNNIRQVFTLCGGHISPILTGCKNIGIDIISVRNEATAVFSADSVSRLSKNIGVAAVTAGPGFTNTITAIKNAQLAQSPILILGGATATVLKNRGSLQDIDHISLAKSVTKKSKSVSQLKDIKPSLEKLIIIARSGVPGPVYLELPVDLLYPESIVRKWYGLKSDSKNMPWWMKAYLKRNVNKLFKNKNRAYLRTPDPSIKNHSLKMLNKVSSLIRSAQRPILLIGSQTMLDVEKSEDLAKSIEKLKIPIFVSGTARSLLSKKDLPVFRHMRKKALKESDLVILSGVPCDFRMDYGRQINNQAKTVSVNLSKKDLYLNRRPNIAILGDPSMFLIHISENVEKKEWKKWKNVLYKREKERNIQISKQSKELTKFVNPIKLCTLIDQKLADGDVIVADGGDFVATASYILRPRSLTGWLDPGVYGTLGVGAGFILGAHFTNKESVVWAIFGDGAFGFSLMEFDKFFRYNIPVVAIIGNDSGWTQIARDQVELLKDPIGTELEKTDYHSAVEGLGGKGYYVDDENQIPEILEKAKKSALEGTPVVVNVIIGKTDFRKGSLSI